jgi:WD domain, G-beta repeat
VATGTFIRSFEGHTHWLYAIKFSPDGTRILSGSADNTMKLWETKTGRLIHTFEVEGVKSVAFSRTGRFLLSGSTDSTIQLWTESGRKLGQMVSSSKAEWLTITPDGFFTASPKGDEMLAIVQGMEVTTIGQIHQSLFSPDLVRGSLAGDPYDEVKRAAAVMNLDKVIGSGPAPIVEITSHPSGSKSDHDLVMVAAEIRDRGKGIGRIEWHVDGVTTSVANAPVDAGPRYDVSQILALDPGENVIEVVAYNQRNFLASLPAQTTITYTGAADAAKPKLHILAVGINAYHDTGWVPPGAVKREYFPPLRLAVGDAKRIASEMQKAGEGMYGEVRVRIALDGEATAESLYQSS